jgi:hypothetical protein
MHFAYSLGSGRFSTVGKLSTVGPRRDVFQGESPLAPISDNV